MNSFTTYLDMCRQMSADISAARVRVKEAFGVGDRAGAEAALCQIECLRRRQGALVAAVREALEEYDQARRRRPEGLPDPATFGKPIPFTARRALESLARLEAAEEDFRVLSMAWADSTGFQMDEALQTDKALQIALRAHGQELPVNLPPKRRGE